MPRSAWLTLSVVSAAVFMVSIELTIIALALPNIRAAFGGASPASLSWVVNAYSITVAALLLLSGWLADRYGRRRIFLTGLVVFAAGSVAAGGATSISVLVASRSIQAIGGSMLFPSGLALLLTAFPRSRHQLAIGSWGAMGGLAAALGPTVGALLINGFSWRAVFLVNVPVAAAALIFGSRVLVDSRVDDVADTIDVVGVPLASLGVAAIILGIVQGETWGWGSASTLSVFGAGFVMIAGFAVRSQRHPAPLFDLGLLRVRSFALGNLGAFFFSVAFFATLVPLPSFIQDVWGWSVVHTGLAVAPGPLVSFLVSPSAGRLADRIGNSVIITVGSVCGVVGMLLLRTLITTEPSIGSLMAGTLLVGASAGTGFAQLVGASLRDVPARQYAMAMAGRTTFFQLSVAFAIALAFAMIGRPAGPDAALSAFKAVWAVCACGYLCNIVLFGIIYPQRLQRLHRRRLGRQPQPSPA